MATKTLRVGNMAYNSTTATLREAFAAYGPTNVQVLNNRGLGLLDVDEGRAWAAIHALHGSRLDGRAIEVREANPGGGPLARRLDEGGEARGAQR